MMLMRMTFGIRLLRMKITLVQLAMSVHQVNIKAMLREITNLLLLEVSEQIVENKMGSVVKDIELFILNSAV